MCIRDSDSLGPTSLKHLVGESKPIKKQRSDLVVIASGAIGGCLFMGVLIMVGVIWKRKNSRPRNLDVVLEMIERPTPRSPSEGHQSPPPDDENSRVSIVVSASGVTSVKYSQNEDSSKMAAKILDNLKTRCSPITENSSAIIV